MSSELFLGVALLLVALLLNGVVLSEIIRRRGKGKLSDEVIIGVVVGVPALVAGVWHVWTVNGLLFAAWSFGCLVMSGGIILGIDKAADYTIKRLRKNR